MNIFRGCTKSVVPQSANDGQIGREALPGKTATPTTSSGVVNAALARLSELIRRKSVQSLPVPAACNLSPLLEESKEEAIKNRDGHLWQCVDRIQVKEGFIYKFRIRDEYNTSEQKYNDPREDAVKNKIKEYFPAVERRVDWVSSRSEWDWIRYYKGTITQQENPEKYKYQKDELERGEVVAVPVPLGRDNGVNENLLRVGYKMEITKEGIHLYLPDEKVLESRWNKMVDVYPVRQLRKVSIVSSKDIATDHEFSQAYIDKKMILSNGCEFVHDHQVHLLPTLALILEDSERYYRARDKFSVHVIQLVEQIKKARKLILENTPKASAESEIKCYERLKKNMVLMDAIPGIAADNLAAVSDLYYILQLENYKDVGDWWDIVRAFADFIKKRHEREVSEKYAKEHDGAPIPREELAVQMEGISLVWLHYQIVELLKMK